MTGFNFIGRNAVLGALLITSSIGCENAEEVFPSIPNTSDSASDDLPNDTLSPPDSDVSASDDIPFDTASDIPDSDRQRDTGDSAGSDHAGSDIPEDTSDTGTAGPVDTGSEVDSAGDTSVDTGTDGPTDSYTTEGEDSNSDTEISVPPNCGDGILTDDEACDDGGHKDNDGCAGDCLKVDDGYSCNPPGVPCRKIAKCGDGSVAFPELCDDGNTDPDDGCSAACKVEIGFKCEGSPSDCTTTICGDDITEGAESCDDGNAMPYDGCSATCGAEPDCSGVSCISECGDGLIIDEECDDGNSRGGDGCSSTCEVEDGYVCQKETECEKINGECVQRIFAVFRDFSSYGDPEGDFGGGGDMIQNLLEPVLDADGKPRAVLDVNALSLGSIASPESFARWYRDTEDSVTKVGSLVLFDNGRGGYVNRWKETGEQWCVDSICYDGTPVFFPVDDLSDGADFVEATIPPEYGGSWYKESNFVTDAALHNYGFTTEVKYWFFFDETKTALLSFLGDDDMWVFVNGIIALDLGNVHMPKDGTVTINAASANQYNLQNGGVYPIQIFHAERNPTGSSFKLTLSGFNMSRSLCRSTCGDGIVALGEECDDGVNDGGYGECNEGCLLGEYCGDGILQDNEDCDDGNTIDGDSCPSSCRDIIVI
jgi:fibro-slime domain-containing protein